MSAISPSLDESLVNRAAPPGSMRYFALLYTPPAKRAAVTALFVIDAEIRESAQSANHDVAHTRLQWWRQEIDRLVNASPQHPATRALATTERDLCAGYAKLHELLAAADMDLARMTYLTDRELRAYCSRSGGATAELIATTLAHPTPLDELARAAVNTIGTTIRATELIRDVRQDAHDGRLYLPLDLLERSAVTLEDLRHKDLPEKSRRALRAFGTPLIDSFQLTFAAVPSAMRAYLRPLYVLGGLHRRLLQRIASSDYAVGAERIELGPLQKPWTAWRAARHAR